ncbi:MAG: OmpH family outer membrane protein [Burkholderiaceae bacterium]|nr:OmpH family outer membrane protein [Burkholderiaceae bacterium]
MLLASNRLVSTRQLLLASRLLAACMLLPMFLMSGAVSAQDTKIGFVNTERILRDSAPAKASQQKLEQEFSKREKSIQDSATKLKEITSKLERDAAVMPESERAKRQREAAELERDLQRRQREFREDLNQRRNEELAAVVERANRVIRQIAESEKFDIIFQEAVYASTKIDITDKVIRALNAPGK